MSHLKSSLSVFEASIVLPLPNNIISGKPRVNQAASPPALACIGKLFGVGLIVREERFLRKTPKITAPNVTLDWYAYFVLMDDNRVGGIYGVNNGVGFLFFLVKPEAR